MAMGFLAGRVGCASRTRTIDRLMEHSSLNGAAHFESLNISMNARPRAHCAPYLLQLRNVFLRAN